MQCGRMSERTSHARTRNADDPTKAVRGHQVESAKMGTALGFVPFMSDADAMQVERPQRKVG